MSKHEEYEFVSKYTGFIQDGITAPFTYAIKRRSGYQPVQVLSEVGGFSWVKSSTFTIPFTCHTDNLCLVRKKPKEPHELYVSINKHTGSLDYMAYDKKDFLELDVDPSSIIKVREVPKE